jgi:hypothetical protein
VLVAAAFGPHGGCEVDQLPGGAPFRGGVGHALGENLVIVDPLAVVGDLPGAVQGLQDQLIRARQKGAGVVQRGVHGHRDPLVCPGGPRFGNFVM